MATNVDAKLLKQTKFPPEFSKKVDMTKVNIEVMKKWIAGKLSELLGDEDDVIIELCFGLLESSRFPDIKGLQIQLTGFLDKDTPKFCQELWNLCISAQSSPQGVPKELLEAKKLELRQEKLDAERAAQEARRRKEQEREREREMEAIRQRERADRGRGYRENRGSWGHDRRKSRSPRRRSPDRRGAPSRREFDSYVPRGSRHGRRSPRTHSHSVSRSPSLSRSPPPRRSHRSDRSIRRRPRSTTSRSPSRSSTEGRGHRKIRRRSPAYGDERERSVARNTSSSRSPSPRRPRRRSSLASSRSPSRSPSPPSRARRRHDRSPSRSRSRQPGNRNRRRRSSSHHSDDRTIKDAKADIAAKPRSSRDDRRLSRSSSPRRDEHSRSRSVTRSRSPRGDRKRRRSLERYAPAARRRRNDSPDSPERHRQSSARAEDVKMKDDSEANRARTNTKTRISATKLRERVLKERLKAMRRRTSVSIEKKEDGA